MRLIIRWTGQLLTLTVVVAVGLVAWGVWLPSSHPVLDRLGLLEPMEQLGVPLASAPPPGAGPPGGGPPGGPPGGRPGGGAPPAVPVVTDLVGQAAPIDRVSAIGTGEALRSVVVAPEAAGRVAEIMVRPGGQVRAGQPILRLDAASEEIARDRAALMLEEAQATAARLERLRASGTATAVQIRDAELAVRNAELTLRQAELDLARRQVLAPIDGWIGLLDVEIGAQVSPSSTIGRIDDRSVLLVDFRLPERLVGRISEGDEVSLSPLARRDSALTGHIRTIDSRVDETARTLRVRAEIANDDDALRAGMAFAIDMRFTAGERPTVDPLAIQWRSEGAFVWLVREERAVRVPVRIVQRRDGMVLVSGDLAPGEIVVLEGVQNLRPGSAVAPRGPGGQARAEDAARGDGRGGPPGGDSAAPRGADRGAASQGSGDGAVNDQDGTTPAGAAEAHARPGASEG